MAGPLEHHRKMLVQNPGLGPAPPAPLLDDHAPLPVHVLGIDGHLRRPVPEDAKGRVHDLGVIGGHGEEVDGFVEARVGVQVRPEPHPDGLQVPHQCLPLEVRGPPESHVLQEVCKPELMLFLKEGAGVHRKAKLHPSLGPLVGPHEVREAVFQRSGADLGVKIQRLRFERAGGEEGGETHPRHHGRREEEGEGEPKARESGDAKARKSGDAKARAHGRAKLGEGEGTGGSGGGRMRLAGGATAGERRRAPCIHAPLPSLLPEPAPCRSPPGSNTKPRGGPPGMPRDGPPRSRSPGKHRTRRAGVHPGSRRFVPRPAPPTPDPGTWHPAPAQRAPTPRPPPP